VSSDNRAAEEGLKFESDLDKNEQTPNEPEKNEFPTASTLFAESSTATAITPVELASNFPCSGTASRVFG